MFKGKAEEKTFDVTFLFLNLLACIFWLISQSVSQTDSQSVSQSFILHGQYA